MIHRHCKGQESSTSSSQVVIGVPPLCGDCYVTISISREKKKVRWRADTVDNELMYKKKSNKCCFRCIKDQPIEHERIRGSPNYNFGEEV